MLPPAPQPGVPHVAAGAARDLAHDPGVRRSLVAIAVVLAATGCGPTRLQTAEAVLLSAPVATAVALGLLWLLLQLWSRVIPGPPPRWRPALVALGFQTAVAIALLARGIDRESDDWWLAALFFVGTSYLVCVGLIARIALARRSFRGAVGAVIWGWLPFWPLALAFAVDGNAEAAMPDAMATAWMVIGYGGAVTAVLWIPLLVEAVVRWRRALRGP